MGIIPLQARPTAEPTMTASASGMSTTRSAPKRSCRPSVARKTPPLTPTSWPSTITRSSASSAAPSVERIASIIVISAISGPPAERPGGRAPARAHRLAAVRSARAGVDVVEDPLGAGRGARLRLGEGGVDLGAQLLHQRLLGGLVDQPLRRQMAAHALDRVEGAVLVELDRIDVARRVVGGVVRAHAVGPGLDERRPLPRPRPRDRPRAGVVHREEVVAVDELAGDAVAGRPRGEARRRGLLAHRGGDGPAVVLEHEDDRRAAHAGEVERLVRVALRRGAVAEVRADDGVEALDAQPPRQADGVRDLRGQRDLEGQHVGLGVHPAAGRLAGVVLHGLGQAVAEAQHRRQLAVLGHDPVAPGLERPGRADDGRLLAVDRREGPQPPLALQREAALVAHARAQHRAPRVEQRVALERRDVALGEGAVGRQQAQRLGQLDGRCGGHRAPIVVVGLIPAQPPSAIQPPSTRTLDPVT